MTPTLRQSLVDEKCGIVSHASVYTQGMRRLLAVFFRLLYNEFAWTYDLVSGPTTW